jgi:hypothetical protein
MSTNCMRSTSLLSLFLIIFSISNGQSQLRLRYTNSIICAGIEVGAKGVKMSLLEIGKNAQTRGAFNLLKDTAINTDFISFTPQTFQNTLHTFCLLYEQALTDYKIPSSNIYTVISSGVKVQAEKDGKMGWIQKLIDSFKANVNEGERKVEVVDATQEARLSHLGIVPENKRFNTFLIDIGSGNTKGGFFPFGNTEKFRLFTLTWGTKSVFNAADKQLADDKRMTNYSRQLYRVLSGAENSEIIYAVNSSGAYPASDNIAFSGGISWAVATLMFPDMVDNSVVSVSFEDVKKFSDKLLYDYSSLLTEQVTKRLKNKVFDITTVAKEVQRVHQVFDQRQLMSGTGLMLKIMRQFQGIYEGKQFFLVKNGQVGWISAYVDQHIK